MNLRIFITGLLRVVGFNSLVRLVYKKRFLPVIFMRQLKRHFLHPSFDFNQSDLVTELMLRRTSYRKAQPVVVGAGLFEPNDPWVLVVDHHAPTPDRDSGSVRMAAILRLLGELGFRITFICHSDERLPHYEKTLEKQRIDVLHGFSAAHRHLKAVGVKYHFALLSRPGIAFRYLHYARAYAPYAKIIYDTVDLHWVRCEREMQLSGDKTLHKAIEKFRRMELLNAAGADLVLAITDEEKNRLLMEHPDLNVTVLSNIHEPCPPRTSFHQRKGLLFIGGFLHKPNEDAVVYFVNNVLPGIIEKIPDVVFYIIGSSMPTSVKSLRSANVEPLGFVADVAPYFESCRLFVAPLRFGAGMKGKVGQSMSYGLPVVSTPIGAEGMGLRHGIHAIIAKDSQSFAESVVALYNDETSWKNLSGESFSYLEANFSISAIRNEIAAIFTLKV